MRPRSCGCPGSLKRLSHGRTGGRRCGHRGMRGTVPANRRCRWARRNPQGNGLRAGRHSFTLLVALIGIDPSSCAELRRSHRRRRRSIISREDVHGTTAVASVQSRKRRRLPYHLHHTYGTSPRIISPSADYSNTGCLGCYSEPHSRSPRIITNNRPNSDTNLHRTIRAMEAWMGIRSHERSFL